MITMDFREAFEKTSLLINKLGEIIIGSEKEKLIKHFVATIIAGGHILIEGPPGSAKTLLAITFSKLISGKFSRIQGNPDLLPTDIIGYSIYRLGEKPVFVPGPIFANIILFDELNRTPTRSQSALLQAMAEKSVVVEGRVMRLEEPFHIIATEIPIEEEVGVYPLTLTLKDRFWIKLVSGYVSREDEKIIVSRSDKLYDFAKLDVKPVMNTGDLLSIREVIDKEVIVSERIINYIVNLTNYLRNHKYVRMGPSHRGPIFLYRISKALALINNRKYVIPDDVKELMHEVYRHRIVLSEDALTTGLTPDKLIDEALKTVEVPKE